MVEIFLLLLLIDLVKGIVEVVMILVVGVIVNVVVYVIGKCVCDLFIIFVCIKEVFYG